MSTDAAGQGRTRPAWHRRAWFCGSSLVGVALVALLVSFPFIAGDPGPGNPAGKHDPAWFNVMGDFVIGFLILGGLLVIAPSLSKWIVGRRAR